MSLEWRRSVIICKCCKSNEGQRNCTVSAPNYQVHENRDAKRNRDKLTGSICDGSGVFNEFFAQPLTGSGLVLLETSRDKARFGISFILHDATEFSSQRDPIKVEHTNFPFAMSYGALIIASESLRL